TDVWPPRPPSESLFVSPHEPMHDVSIAPRPRLLGRIAVVAIIVLAVQGGVFWQLQRSAADKRRQVAAEMHDFETRAGALRAGMAVLQSKIGATRSEIERLRTQPAPAPVAAPPAAEPSRPVGRPPAQARPRPRPEPV